MIPSRNTKCTASAVATWAFLLVFHACNGFVVQSPASLPHQANTRGALVNQRALSSTPYRENSRQQRFVNQRLQASLVDITTGHDLVQLSDFCHNQLDLLVGGAHSQLDLSQSSPATFESTTTFLSSSSSAYLQPAHEHAQPLWGPPDPYLSAGKSIAPLSSVPSSSGATAALDAATTSPFSSASQISTASPELAQQVRLAAARGWNVLDAQAIKGEPTLPGFAETGGILPRHVPNMPLEETPATFAAQVEWSASFLRVVDRLPYAALMYALVEFLVLRPNVDLYKEDVEDDPARALANSIKVTTVRLGAFAFVAIVTLIMFGG